MQKGLIIVAAAVAMSLAVPAARAGEGGFTNVTKESGIEALVAKNYDYQPKFWLSGITLADLDGDGSLDVLLSGHGFVGSAAYNDGKGHFTALDPKLEEGKSRDKAAEVPFPGGEIRLVYDFNEDGKLDVAASYGDNRGVAYLNDCTSAPGALGAPGLPSKWNFKAFTPGFDSYSRGVAVADLNRDGLVDYLRGPESRIDLQTTVSLGQGQAKWLKGPTIATLKEAGIIPVDINGDGFLDLLVNQNGYNPTQCKVLLNDGKMNFKDATAEAGVNPDGALKGVGDLNQDGFPDLICVENGQIIVYLNDGKGHFTKGPAVTGVERARNKMPQTAWGAAVVVDIDNDGIPDVVINAKNTMYVLRGMGGGKLEFVSDTWGLPTAILGNMQESGASFGDLDNDGMLDFVISGPGPGGKDPGVAVYHNDLPRQHWVNVQLVGVKGNMAATSAKVRVYEPGGLNDAAKLLAYEQIAVWGRESFHSYYAKAHTERHFGLGKRGGVDVSVEFYPSGKKVEKKGVKADKIVTVTEATGAVDESDLR